MDYIYYLSKSKILKMSIQVKNKAIPDIPGAFPGVPSGETGNWIVMQYDTDSSMKLITPGKDPEVSGYPEKPGIIRNDEANIYISAGWDAGRGRPIWGMIPIRPAHDYVMTKQTFDSTTGYSGTSSWVTGITAATTSNYQSNTFNKYSPPYIAELSSSTTNLRYVYGLFWTSGTSGTTIQTRTETLKTILNNKKMPTITVGGTTFVAAKVIVYTKKTIETISFTPETIYDVCFDKIISSTNTQKYVVIRITVTKSTSTATPTYSWDVYFDDGPYITSTIIPQYLPNSTANLCPNDFFKTSNNNVEAQWFKTVNTPIVLTGGSYISGYGLGSTNNANAYTQINKGSSKVCMHSPGLCCWLQTSSGLWFPHRQLHARSTTTGKSIYVEGNARWAPVYNTIIEFENILTGEIMTIKLIRDDIYTLAQLGVGVTGTLRWSPTVNSRTIYKQI